MADDLRRLGAPREIVEAWEREPDIPTLDVLADCRPAVELFLASATQWRLAGQSAVAVGLDYAGVAVVARSRRVRLDAALLDDLQIMEGAALAALSEARRGG